MQIILTDVSYQSFMRMVKCFGFFIWMGFEVDLWPVRTQAMGGTRRVQGNLPGMGAGGVTEFLFNQNIPASAIKIIR